MFFTCISRLQFLLDVATMAKKMRTLLKHQDSLLTFVEDLLILPSISTVLAMIMSFLIGSPLICWRSISANCDRVLGGPISFQLSQLLKKYISTEQSLQHD